MKNAVLFASLFLLSTLAFGQTNIPVQPTVQFHSHPRHATQQPMATLQSLLGTTNPYTFATGEVPLSEVQLDAKPAEVPLGTVARTLRSKPAVNSTFNGVVLGGSTLTFQSK